MDHWTRTYLDALPDELQPQPASSRFQTAAGKAQTNGWHPAQIARVVLATDYTRTRNPAAIALIRLEEHSERQPSKTTAGKPEDWRANLPDTCPHPNAQTLGLNPNQCHACRAAAGAPRTMRVNPRTCLVCPPGHCCLEPITEPTPTDWIDERAQLIAHLIATPGMTEDQREDAMRTLIAKQRAT